MRRDTVLKKIPGLPFGTYISTTDETLAESLKTYLETDYQSIEYGGKTYYFIPVSEDDIWTLNENGIFPDPWEYMNSDLDFSDVIDN